MRVYCILHNLWGECKVNVHAKQIWYTYYLHIAVRVEKKPSVFAIDIKAIKVNYTINNQLFRFKKNSTIMNTHPYLFY